MESLIRAHQIALTEPAGPTYVCFDATLQEQPLEQPVEIPDLSRFGVPPSPQADAATLEQAAEWLTKYALMSPERARQRVRFIDQYRSYVINYNLGKDLVRQYVEREAGSDSEKRWEVFEELLSTPRLPSGLK